MKKGRAKLDLFGRKVINNIKVTGFSHIKQKVLIRASVQTQSCHLTKLHNHDDAVHQLRK